MKLSELGLSEMGLIGFLGFVGNGFSTPIITHEVAKCIFFAPLRALPS